MDIDERLRAQSKLLLQKLKARQGKLQRSLELKETSGYSSREESLLEETLMKSARKNGVKVERTGGYGVESVNLDSSTTALKHDTSLKSKIRSELSEQAKYERDNKENFNTANESKELDSNSFEGKNLDRTDAKQVQSEGTDAKVRAYSAKQTQRLSSPEKSELKKSGVRSRSAYNVRNRRSRSPKARSPKRKSPERSRTPTTLARRRKIIDKNVKVDSELSDNEFDCTLEQSGLNYSYSNLDESDLDFVRNRIMEGGEEYSDVRRDYLGEEVYTDNLRQAGNDKKVAKMIRESHKPKSILMNGSKSLKKSLGKVSFLSSKDSSSFNSELMDPNHTRQLLGYDWIAALLDNNHRVMDNSEAYFEELREFRRLNRDECQNQFYMEGPEALFYETTDKEPTSIKEILEDNKVKPYIVNERLFTEPIKKSLFPGEEEVDKAEYPEPRKEPTFEEPRFVRVSIPRSTLSATQRVKPHRRNSLEGRDTMALSQHCQMGYESFTPSMVPSASNLSLRDGSKGIKSKMQTDEIFEAVKHKTLAEAEKIANSFPYPWNTTSPQNDLRKPSRSDLYQSHLDMSLPYSMRSKVAAPGDESVKLKRATEDLLNSTYSLMYEMENMKRDREIQNSRIGRV